MPADGTNTSQMVACFGTNSSGIKVNGQPHNYQSSHQGSDNVGRFDGKINKLKARRAQFSDLERTHGNQELSFLIIKFEVNLNDQSLYMSDTHTHTHRLLEAIECSLKVPGKGADSRNRRCRVEGHQRTCDTRHHAL